jgi:hypothetical protein
MSNVEVDAWANPAWVLSIMMHAMPPRERRRPAGNILIGPHIVFMPKTNHIDRIHYCFCVFAVGIHAAGIHAAGTGGAPRTGIQDRS